MMKKTLFIAMTVITVITLSSCSSGTTEEPGTPENPTQPSVPNASLDSVAITIGCNMPDDTQSFVTARSDGGDLFGVNILQYNGNEYIPYATGVFDDLDNIQFKFVKDRTYYIAVNYTPDAKSFIYKYPNGTYGYPFSSIYGLQNYSINTPVYDTGKPHEGGYIGEVLNYLFYGGYQSNESGYFQDSYTLGTTPRYIGFIDNVKVNEATSITVPLKLYASAIKLNVGNFDNGKIRLDIPAISSGNVVKEFSPGDDMTQMFWIGGGASYQVIGEYETKIIRIYYTSPDNETYLLATKSIDFKPATTYVFNFDLTGREDGSIGITINDKMTEEEVSLD